MEYVITLSVISEKYGMGAEDLVRCGVITEKEAERLRLGAVKALRASSVNAICEEVGCLPGDLFALRERVVPAEENDCDKGSRASRTRAASLQPRRCARRPFTGSGS